MPLQQIMQYLLLDITEGRLSLTLKINTDRHTDPCFDHVIRIEKRDAQPLRKLASNSGFTAARKADQGQHGFLLIEGPPCSSSLINGLLSDL